MELGLIGLGKMGNNMRLRLINGKHTVYGYDAYLSDMSDVDNIESLVKKLRSINNKVIIWLMVPSGKPTDKCIQTLCKILSPGDYIIDGGNSNYKDSIKHSEYANNVGIKFIDAGVSGGIWGKDNGYSLMVGGATEDVEYLKPIFHTLSPNKELGFIHTGAAGSGHFVKMIHNGIEYAMMQTYGEGYELIAKSDIVNANIKDIFNSWLYGSVVRSWLLELSVKALEEHPKLNDIDDYCADSGEGRWTVEYAIEKKVPVNTIAASLFARFYSQQETSKELQLVSALRQQFGGHNIHKK